MEEGEAEAVQDVEEEPGDTGGQEEGEEAPATEEGEKAPEQATVPVKARIICGSGEEPMTIGKALVPGGSPLHMEVPGAGTLVLTASLKAPPEPPPGAGGEVKCICPTGGKRRGGAEEQIKALTTTMEQISSMQQLLSDMKNKAQALSQQLVAGGRGPPPPQQPMGMPQPPPYGVPGAMTRPMPFPDLGRGPPGGKEVFSAPGVGIYVVQKDVSAMAGGMQFDYMGAAADPRAMQGAPSCPACDSILPLPPTDFGQRDWAPAPPMAPPPPMAPTQSRGGDGYLPSDGGNVCCGGGGQMVCCGGGGGMTCCGGGRVVCCGGGIRVACCGGGVPISCCGPRVNTCCGGGGSQQQQQGAGYSRAPNAEQDQALCQGDCTIPCDSPATCMGRNR